MRWSNDRWCDQIFDAQIKFSKRSSKVQCRDEMYNAVIEFSMHRSKQELFWRTRVAVLLFSKLISEKWDILIQKNRFFNYECKYFWGWPDRHFGQKKNNGSVAHSQKHIRDFVLADTSLNSPPKSFIFILKNNNVNMINVPQAYFHWFWQQNHWCIRRSVQGFLFQN